MLLSTSSACFNTCTLFCFYFPPTGIVGEIDEASGKYYIWTHKKLEIGYNGKQIVDVNLTSDIKVELTKGVTIPFTYQVLWKKSSVPFKARFDKYLDPSFFQHRVGFFHKVWFVYISVSLFR